MTISTGIITTIAGNGTNGFSGDNDEATSAQLDYPNAIALDISGNLYIRYFQAVLTSELTL